MFFFAISLSLKSQIDCGAVPTQQFLDDLEAMMQGQTGCTDDFGAYDLNVPITFNLILRYNTMNDGTGGFTPAELLDIELGIQSFYDPLNLFFNVIWTSIQCSACFDSYSNWDSRPVLENCIVGDIVHPDTPTEVGGSATIGLGDFWAKPHSVSHELGHALGLLHTFDRVNPGNGVTEELVRRQSDANCDCNCLEKGDKICDTEADPYWHDFSNPPEKSAWNNAMFSYNINCTIRNLDNEQDACGDLYAEPAQNSLTNVMSYHICREILTPGQNLRIRTLNDLGNGSFKWQYDPLLDDLESGMNVNTPLVIDSDRAFHGDLIVNSLLKIENSTIEFTPGHGIIINEGGHLYLKNAVVREYSGDQCYTASHSLGDSWTGIKILPNHSSLTKLTICCNSVIEKSEFGLWNDSPGLLNLNIYDSEFHSTSIRIADTYGSLIFRQSYIGNGILLENNFFAGVYGCSFGVSLPTNSTRAIHAIDTHLEVNQSHTGTKTFIPGGEHGILFESSGSHKLWVRDTDFANCRQAIKVDGTMGQVRVSYCDFDIPAYNGESFNHRGILLEDVMDFEIFGNTFTGKGNVQEVGIEYKSNGSNNQNSNIIINNVFTDVQYGVYSDRGLFGGDLGGIEYKCNIFDGTRNSDFQISFNINPEQGSETHGAGNEFSRDGGTYSDFWYGTDFYTEYFWRAEGNQELLNFWEIDKVGDAAENPANCTFPIISQGPPTPDTHVSNFDNGDTKGIIKIIKDTVIVDPDFLDSFLTAISPWVSIPIMQEVVNNSIYFTQAQVANLIAANPWTITDPYINFLVFQSGSFSTSNQQIIRAAFNAGDARMDYESGHLAFAKTNDALIRNSTLTEAIDSNGYSTDSLVQWLGYRAAEHRHLQVVEERLAEGDIAEIDDAISHLDSLLTGDPIAIDEARHYKEIARMHRDYLDLGQTWSDLDSADIGRLEEIANQYHGLATVKARKVLEIYHGYTFSTEPERPQYDAIEFSDSGERTTAVDDMKKSEIVVYPNPFSGHITIDLGYDPQDGTRLLLYGMDDRLIKAVELNHRKTILSLDEIHSGIYMIEIVNDEAIIHRQKVIKVW